VVAQHVCSFVTCFSPAVVPNTSIRSISNNNRGAIGRGGGKTILGGGGEGGGGMITKSIQHMKEEETGTTPARTRKTASRITAAIPTKIVDMGIEQQQDTLMQQQQQQSTFSFPIQVICSSPSSSSSTTLDDTSTITTNTADEIQEQSRKIISSWYKHFMESTSFFQRDPNDASKFTIPLFGRTTVTLSEQVLLPEGGGGEGSPVEFRIHVDGTPEKDYAMLCAKMYESLQEYKKKECSAPATVTIHDGYLKDVVKKYFQNVEPHPGYDAKISSDSWPSCSTIEESIILNQDDDNVSPILDRLMENGYVTIETNVKTTPFEMVALSNLLTSKTTQEQSVRSDTVAFIDWDMARQCGIEKQFRLLMGMADYLNRKLPWDSMRTGYKPIFPATEEYPLTNPANIQIASYGCGEFYVPHSDNLLLMQNKSGGDDDESGRSRFVRSNYRQYTCILYCNDDWDFKVHGGALRIYPGTTEMTDPMSVKGRQNMPYEDINPTNGKLLIFDSRLVHSVEKVLDPHRKRVAMTVWINRPEDSGVSVDIWNENEGRVEWYRLF